MSKKADPADRHPVAPGVGASLADWLAYLESIHPVEIDLGLDRVLMVLRRLFPKRPRARVITVAGTNGKGSAVACLSQLLLQAGRTVGTYTSPHLHVYNERVTVNGLAASDASLVAAFERIEAARAGVSLTYFEFGTLAAFLVMAEAGVQDWVLEVGLGGRLDAVNVLDADLAIITSVDIDHVAFLGDDREVIGFEKAGIFRPGVPAIYADEDPPSSVLQQVAAQRIPLSRLGLDYAWSDGSGETRLTVHSLGRTLRLPLVPLPGNSVAAATVAALMLEPALDDQAVWQALGQVSLPGRFEKLASFPAVYADVGHNPHAARWLARQVANRRSAGGRVHAVYACLGDKDAEGVARAMAEVVDRWVLAGLNVPRGLSADELSQRTGEVLHGRSLEVAETVVGALSLALEGADTNDLVVVFGSFFTVAEARTALLEQAP